MPNYFEMETNQIKTFDVFLTPSENKEVTSKLNIIAERLYEPQNEFYGIFNPKKNENKENKYQSNKRKYMRKMSIMGKGSDGVLNIQPEEINFETVKAGFQKNYHFQYLTLQ